jgi:hypothetical protein
MGPDCAPDRQCYDSADAGISGLCLAAIAARRCGFDNRIDLSASPPARAVLQAEFANIFNRTLIGNPSTTAPGATPSKNAFGQYSAGFGVINLTVVGAQTAPTYTQNAVVGQLFELPRTGTLIARISF